MTALASSQLIRSEPSREGDASGDVVVSPGAFPELNGPTWSELTEEKAW
jgi:hypothetical protein